MNALEQRMRNEIARLRRGHENPRAVKSCDNRQGDIVNVAFCRFEGGDTPTFTLSISGGHPEADKAELARLTLALVGAFPISHVAWLDDSALLERSVFLAALGQEQDRLFRPTRPVTTTTRRRTLRHNKARRPSPAVSQWKREKLLRAEFCRDLTAGEVREMRRCAGLPSPERRVASAILTASVVVAMNTSGAVASVLSMAGAL
ncbi:hypothetical protein PGB28_18810 [Primorskyibacter aestuariivivens]|uniref:hypothetical protein n=1 Tax=Primorskyibacter aestuariivivens TaxID=1888912 RepID=UPI0022FFDBE5|nr:hypothetical protein [Primorskyibacter aestuariivivens]MDA7430517.1 hypothetical protein [Primorskyibacter aestuariivivens]